MFGFGKKNRDKLKQKQSIGVVPKGLVIHGPVAGVSMSLQYEPIPLITIHRKAGILVCSPFVPLNLAPHLLDL